MNFSEWLASEAVQIQHIDPEEDWDLGDQAYQVAKAAGIRPSSTNNPTIVALNQYGDVVGAAFTSWDYDDDATQMAGQPMHRWTFDIAVHPKWQGFDMVGIKLIRQAEQERKNLEAMYGNRAYTSVHVVNPQLAKLLQHPKFGYEKDDYQPLPKQATYLTKYD